MLSDPIADMLTRIRNGYLAKKRKVAVLDSKVKYEIAKVLQKENYIKSVNKEKKDNFSYLIMELLYKNNRPAITRIVKISKPSRKVYCQRKKIPQVLGGFGKMIVSTPQGMMTGQEARKRGIGGELICKLW